MFTTGRIIFVSIFLVTFVIAMVWSYKKEKSITQIHFKKSYKIDNLRTKTMRNENLKLEKLESRRKESQRIMKS